MEKNSCLCKTAEKKRENKNNKNHACQCRKQSVNYRNPIRGKTPKRLRIHQAEYIVKHGKIPIWRRTKHIKSKFRYHISHICGRSLCRNPKHLIKETQKENISRLICHRFMIMYGWTTSALCWHEPKCLYCY